MTAPDPLRDELRELADAVAPADLYERSLHRSRKIGRREAAIGTTAAVVALALLGSGLWRLPSKGSEPSLPVAVAPVGQSAPASSAPAATATVVPPGGHEPAGEPQPNRPRPPKSTPKPRSTSLGDLPGQVFYADSGDDGKVLRLTSSGRPRTVLSASNATAGVSPDGSQIAYVSDGTLMVADTGGGEPRQAYAGKTSAEQAPAWSPDGGRLLIDAAETGVLDVATGELTPLPDGLEGQHFRWSGDGSTLVYATPDCGLEVAAGTTAQSGTPVPDQSDTDGKAACRPVSVDATGDLVAVQLEPAAEQDEAPADAVLDTVTGDVVELPVTGRIVGAVFDPDGNLLVRSKKGDRTRLWLFAPDFTLLVQAREPSSLAGLDLLAYTR
jgi:TolB protein